MAQVLVLVQRLDRRPRRRSIAVDSDVFGFDADFPDDPEPEAQPAEAPARPAGLAYITVTDAAGRVLFRRAATPQEVDDALSSADEATREGEAVMERIAYDRMFEEILGEAE